MPKKPKTTRKQKAEYSKNRIYAAATALIAAKGYDQTSIKDIVQKAGVSIGTFYHYFKSKHAILEEDFSRADALFQDLPESIPADLPSPERILRYMDQYSQLLEDNGVEYDSQLYTCRNRLFVKRGRAMQLGLVRIVAEGQARGELATEPDAEYICEYIFLAARGVAFDWCLRQGKGDIKVQMREYLGRLLEVFLPRAKAKGR